ncbi:UgpA ABC-type sugar transport systems, permease components [Candidatus Planktophila versatilis]|uniref:carbohydrate ABC transporter permease n=1 Tax=Candidatus Planktophila versatilis TaxID=1884905 RepID=UPI003BEEB656
MKKGYPRFFLLPGLLLLIAIIIFPLLFTIRVTFSSWNVSQSGLNFIGGENWGEMVRDTRYWSSLLRLFYLSFLTVAIQYVLGFAIALFAWKGIAARRFYRVLWLIPMMTTPSLMAIIWRSIFTEDIGALNGLLSRVGLDPVNWLTESGPANIAITIVEVWQWTPFMFLILLAGLLSLPKEPFMAAAIDGASAWKTFARVTFPMMAPISIGAIMIRLIDASKIFDSVFTMTRGGPGNATETPAAYIFQRSLQDFQIAYGSTLALMYLILAILTLTIIGKVFARLSKPRGI